MSIKLIPCSFQKSIPKRLQPQGDRALLKKSGAIAITRGQQKNFKCFGFVGVPPDVYKNTCEVSKRLQCIPTGGFGLIHEYQIDTLLFPKSIPKHLQPQGDRALLKKSGAIAITRGQQKNFKCFGFVGSRSYTNTLVKSASDSFLTTSDATEISSGLPGRCYLVSKSVSGCSLGDPKALKFTEVLL
ncbi:hypothetical protein CEXT_403541 [Caerostris extrusa]|uniref:Uncharacterized protein n=1 Tax=Caerostris extrusa TaxID=172846 RepID=A0AAV4RKZ1_CAEEX|nr:hypothetical protein CEXT_403541 [Caerostris extrusa]